MLKKFDKQYIIDNKGCYSLEQVEKLSFINNKTITIKDILKSEIKVKDKGWFLVKKCNLSDKEKRDLAYELAYVVLPIFEAKNPNDKRVRECLEAIQLFNNGKIDKDQLIEKRIATNDAAAYATNAAATNAAYAATNAAYAIINATDAVVAYASVAYATNAAVYASDAAAKGLIEKIKNKLKNKKSYNEILVDTMVKFYKKIK